MNFKAIYQKPIQAIKWTYKKVVDTVKWNVNHAIKFVKWNKDQIVAILSAILKGFVATYTWTENKIKELGRFWIGILTMTAGAYVVSNHVQDLMLFLSGQVTEGNLTFGLFMIFIGFVCVLFSANYSEITTFFKK